MNRRRSTQLSRSSARRMLTWNPWLPASFSTFWWPSMWWEMQILALKMHISLSSQTHVFTCWPVRQVNGKRIHLSLLVLRLKSWVLGRKASRSMLLLWLRLLVSLWSQRIQLSLRSAKTSLSQSAFFSTLFGRRPSLNRRKSRKSYMLSSQKL